MNELSKWAQALKYYSRKEVQEAIVREALHREVGVRFLNGGFGKRPDTITSPQEIIEFAKRKVVSFHFSEELWKDPLMINDVKNLDEIRIGWDLIIDVDGINFDFSKIATKWYLKIFDNYDLKPSLKFSGDKGFHIGLPYENFPKEVYGKPINQLFPEAPKKIAMFIGEKVKKQIARDVLKKYSVEELMRITNKKFDDLIVNDELNIDALIEVDTVLVSSRHLFRAAYSFHEKSGLISLPLSLKQFKNFERDDASIKNITDFDKWFIERKDFMLNGKAKRLFVEAFDFLSEKEMLDEKEIKKIAKKVKRSKINFDSNEINEKGEIKHEIKLTEQIKENIEKYSPPCIIKLLKGLKDGRKRALFIYLNYLHTLGFSKEEIEERIWEWNERNNEPLRESYVKGQLKYFLSRKPFLPPNCNRNEFYKDIGICEPNELCKTIKNPVAYATKLILRENNLIKKPMKSNIKRNKTKKDSKE